MVAKTMEELVSLCKRRGFIFPSNDIYGGVKGLYDYGPMGVELKNNLKQSWWKSMVYERDDIEGLDASILTSPDVLKHSGHEDTFTDPLVDCRSCKSRCKAENLENNSCPNCKSKDLTDPRPFNLMFKTNIGPVEDGSSFAYLRPETCQQIFTNFKNVLDSTNRTLPFGVAQIGKVFRNEIIARQFVFRMREFEQMEMQFFVRPGTQQQWYEKWKKNRMNWHISLGLGKENYRFHDHIKVAHYADAACDIEYNFPFGFKEIEGIHSRTDYDLSQHEKHSGKKLQYFDTELNKSYIPYVVETSIGLDRMFLAVLSNSLVEEELDNNSSRTVLKIPSILSPYKVAILPLVKKDGLSEIATDLYNKLKIEFNIIYDEKDAVGRRYRRQDAIGTPLCITVDHQTLDDNTITIRNRDTMEQKRISIDSVSKEIMKEVNLKNWLKKNS